jgi:hypothetical protein
MSEEKSIEYITDNLYYNKDNEVIVNFPNFQLIQNTIEKTFHINFYMNKRNIIVFIENNSIKISDQQNNILFIDGETEPNINFINDNLQISEYYIENALDYRNNVKKYIVNYKGYKIAEINLTINNFLLNSVFFGNIYLENIKLINEQYQKLRIYPDNVTVNINGISSKDDVISFIFTNHIIKKYDSIDELDNYYLVQMNHYFNGFYAKKIYLYFNFSRDGTANLIETDEATGVDAIRNNLIEQEDMQKSNVLGKRSRYSDEPLTYNKRR